MSMSTVPYPWLPLGRTQQRVYRALGNNTSKGSERKEFPQACWVTWQNQGLIRTDAASIEVDAVQLIPWFSFLTSLEFARGPVV
jgi:hypothetical protein